MIYVYCPRRSQGAFELVKALNGTRLRDFDGMNFWNKGKKFPLVEGDVVICWGAQVPEIDGIRVLNALDSPMNKLNEIKKLQEHGIPTVTYSEKKMSPSSYRTWVPRSRHHQGGADLLGLDDHAHYWVVKENFTREFRIHSFDGSSIRAGVKVPREGFVSVPEGQAWQPNSNMIHPWVRSFDGGWRIKYDGFQSTPKLRALAHGAVKALGLTFGAVDIAEVGDGLGLKVLEVNSAPGIEGGTLAAYVRKINSWLEGRTKSTKKAPAQTPDIEL